MKKWSIAIISILLLSSCGNERMLTKYANPFVGAADAGHCMPGASFPFGMIQAGPQSGNCSWDYTGGYQYKDTVIQGFSQTRINGTGCPDLGDLLILPFSNDIGEYASTYDKKSEVAQPGYYKVYLNEAGAKAEMTATPHVAIHHYVFNDPAKARVLIDFQNGITGDSTSFHNFVLDSRQSFDSEKTISGYAHTKMWVERYYYYHIEFSKPYRVKEILPFRNTNEKAHRYVLEFDMGGNDQLYVKIALSSKSVEGAKENMAAEINDFDFTSAKRAAHKEWEKYLSKIIIDGTREQKDIFYTSMYHLFIQPNNIADVSNPPFYSTLSLWDTYRAAHPLYTIIAPEKVNDIVNSMLHQYDLQGFLPIWSLWGIENYCMIGNHSVPVIVDAYLKGFKGFDAERAYYAIKKSLTTNLPKTNCTVYDKYGYYPFDIVKNESVSRTLECSYDDYCAAQFAKALGKESDYQFFINRSTFYKNVFDPSTSLMRAKDSKGNWRTPFDKFVLSHDSTCGGDYTEGNAWQYSWHVQQDIDGLVNLMGGKEAFANKLDTLFSLNHTVGNAGFSKDVTGLIGQYAHGNEPSHHVAYLYALAGKPYKTQEMVHKICKTMYQDRYDGLCGNDDCGQMSAWYVFSSLGFYPVNPCGGEYVLGAPQLPEAKLTLANGKTFKIEAVNYSPDNIYVKKITLDGAEYKGNTISHSRILEGGTLKFYMSDKIK